jgi:hypothetical protein
MSMCRHGGALRGIAIAAGLVALGLGTPVAEAQSREELPAWADSLAVVTPGPTYGKSGLWTVFAGRHYRDLWTIPIRVPVVNLQRFAGGLTPLAAHAGHQTTSLRFSGADGKQYQFRTINKDPTALLAPALQGSAYAKALQDGVSASFPGAPLVANPLLVSAGVLVDNQTLALLPDDPTLGEFRDKWKGVLGLLEERPPSTSDSTETLGPKRVVSPAGLFRRIDKSPDHRVDTRAFLRARLMDMYLGDRDRHRDQFRWADFGGKHPTVWQPISRDHDEAFVQLDGLSLDLARFYFPPLITFHDEYPSHVRLNWHSREIDRRFLAGLDRATWDSVATALQRTLTDAAIDSAVRRMPAEMYPVGGPRLDSVLRARRDGLVGEALSYYAFLSRQVEIRATDAAEVAEVNRVDPHHLEVTVRAKKEEQPYFHRVFADSETREVSLKMWGGDDRVVVRGNEPSAIRLRVVSGAGDDVLVDSTASGGTRFYDDSGNNVTEGSRPIDLNTKRYDEWIGSDTNRYPPREWGSWTRPLPWLEISSDLGLFIGAGLRRTTYGFRKEPYASEVRVRAGYATAAQAGRLDFDADVHPENSAHFWRVHAMASGLETLRFYGPGNDSPNEGTSDFFRVDQQRYELMPALVVPVGKLEVGVGPLVRFTSTGQNNGRFIATLADTITGGQDFGQVGGRLTLDLDALDRDTLPLRVLHITAVGEVNPATWDVESAFGSVQAQVEGTVSADTPASPSLALRVGGRKVWGEFPFFESAFVGGSHTVAGYHSNRFAGDASLYGGALVRLTAGAAPLALPAIWGVFGNFDLGRVYVGGDSPGGWHTGGGGGLWLGFLDRKNSASLGIATSSEGTLLQAGLVFGIQ